ncbi:UNVERIFIED_CONTAM: hypothetical protein Slati_0424500, partial [Sesamum latifolium]
VEGQGHDTVGVETVIENDNVPESVNEIVTENVSESVNETVTENVPESVNETVTENVPEMIENMGMDKGKRKLYERFLNESSSEFDDSSDEDYVQSGEGSDSEAPSVVLEDIECESDDDIFLSKNPSKKELMMKLIRVMKDKKKKTVPERFETGNLNGLVMMGMKMIWKVLRDWCIRNGVDIEFLRNEAARMTAKCKVEGYEWRIHASPILGGPTFQIKTLKGNHTCAMNYENRLANASYLARRIENAIRDHPTIPIAQLKNRILSKCNMDVSRFK